ncbi:hypothetical protein ACJIZ3_019432 [Penstemon smallii]|uniref:ELM2 domain-containing protein n=1 Tax=Penstemon smallii TaxID=265156 RepID=A0ABD3T166_9LAMI
MGAKRPLEEEIFPELSFKQPKQFDYYKMLTSNKEDFPSQGTVSAIGSPGQEKNNFCVLQADWGLENGDTDGASAADKDLEASAPLSLVTSSGSEEDAGNENSSYWSLFPGYFDFRVPRGSLHQFEDPYTCLFNSSPRKEVPIGPGHQAEIPQWDGKKSSDSSSVEQKLMGTCVIPTTSHLNDSTIDVVRVGCGRTECSCHDVGSMRCVQQHIKEAREKLWETLGEDRFKELGFYDMGEEVASKWTAYDEQVFHEVIFTNPVRHGKNFWEHLKTVFPTRTNMELVSYYFNVFMLRRRAVQNRSYSLEIDSDDDEEHKGAHGEVCQNRSSSLDIDTDGEEYSDDDYKDGPRFGSYVVSGSYFATGEDEDSVIKTFADEDLDAGWLDGESWPKPENVHQDQGKDGNHGTFDDVHMKERETMKMHDKSSFDSYTTVQK